MNYGIEWCLNEYPACTLGAGFVITMIVGGLITFLSLHPGIVTGWLKSMVFKTRRQRQAPIANWRGKSAYRG